MGAVATSISSVGVGIGQVGPVHTFARLHSAAKWILAWLMLIRRLEIFTVFIILPPFFWRYNYFWDIFFLLCPDELFFHFALMQSGAQIKNTSPSFFGKKQQKIPLSLHEPSTMYSNAQRA